MRAGLPMKESSIMNLKIGENTYSLYSDDNYLKNMRRWPLPAVFEPKMVQLFSTLINKSDCVLDIGANVGCTSILFGELADKVYSFEASPSTFKLLETNIAQSGLKNIEIFNSGVGAESGESTLTFSADNRSGGFVSDQTQASAGHIIETINIKPADELVDAIGLHQVDFIKIDVEGFEGQVIKGAQQLLRKSQPIVVLELNHWCLNAFQRTSLPDFFDHLRSVFPLLYAVDGRTYLDLHRENESYIVMYRHINKFRYPNIVAGFNGEKLQRFFADYDNKAPMMRTLKQAFLG